MRTFDTIFTFIKSKKFLRTLFILLLLLFFLSYFLKEELLDLYAEEHSLEILDRNGIAIVRYPNEKGHYSNVDAQLPQNLKELLIKKEDRFFYYHPGINPGSIGRAFFNYVFQENPGGSSTITQQLVKILLGNEQERTLSNKLVELLYTISLEIHLTKDEILDMYAKSVYLGNQAQGFASASDVYFDKSLPELNDMELLSLLATISSPSVQNPWKERNADIVKILAEKFNIGNTQFAKATKQRAYNYQLPASFELQSMGIECLKICSATIDQGLTENLREILKRNILHSYERGVRNGAIVVIKVPENELIAIVGSHNPQTISSGSQINMALEPRPIGSTVKPFIYVKGFESGLRPYTKVDDREYKYPVATGFPLYPKNYDGKYRGEVTLHEALSNSLNVPSIKVLEYIGLNNFYDFLDQKLTFLPIQNYEMYQYGIALGGLEMDLLTLTHFFTIFTNNGVLSPLKILIDHENTSAVPPQSRVAEPIKVVDEKYIQLVNKILNDRKTGVEQFGIKSNLNLTQGNYAVKTGTSRDFHDSWVVGYTPDFVVGVWLGNSENKPLLQVSGQSGSGDIWQEVMELMFSTLYNKESSFTFDKIGDFAVEKSIEYGFLDDVLEEHRNLLAEDNIILSPYNEDTFEFTDSISIPFISRTDTEWFANGAYVGEGKSIRFYPKELGWYEIEARTKDSREIIRIKILNGDS